MEFHISRALRDKLGLDDLLFSYTGNVVFGNVAASRKLALQLEQARAADGLPPEPVNAGALFAMGLIDELNHALIARYREEIEPDVWSGAVKFLVAQSKLEDVDKLLLAFTEQFPNVAVYRGELTAKQWLAGSTDGLPNRDAALEELLLLHIANINPAFSGFKELFEDSKLQEQTIYKTATQKLPEYFAALPPIDPELGSLFDALRAPFLASPDSLTGQLDFIRERLAKHISADLRRILLAVDTLREEDIAIWMRFNPAAPDHYRHGAPGRGGEGFVGDEYIGFDDQYIIGPDGQRTLRYAVDYQAPLVEYEAFSADQAWMPNVVLMAKSTYVWLEQLSKKYKRHIFRLDQIPDEELQLLAERGITGLWLIGLWERSVASRTIKRLRGHHDSVASAYSLKDYQIAEDLGGNSAYENLRDRAGAHGLRLASDMVPNHMGIDSPWVIEHPDWFVFRWESPFPAYSFNGPDLSSDSRVEIKIDDHYYDQTDAAVAFRLRHHSDGSTRYVYHGNDGTTFAWNDTAQLDYSKAYVREQVMQVILHVARLFPIIRFDAAMVLAKRHVQRLWFPLPGAGGSIPSRAENAMSQEEFDALMPLEFWREVVDRVAVEVPGTLLLAEAFWMLEGYFVRTLGMHRVYNSAFMNMLRDEENAKYRSYLKKTIEFDPDILKRYVNFMSNPDERTAIDQFGSGDKCFGVATLMSTLPGLPMFGHGQIEGYTERYGMEYKQAKMDEWPNEDLVARHQREIAPLLKNRRIFAESQHFVLYDFWAGGTVDENVFAYSNRMGHERSLILYNNAYNSTQGSIHHSVASMDKGSGEMRQRSLAEALDLPWDDSLILAWRDTARGLEYLRRANDFHNNGFGISLRGYQYAVLLHWRELRSTAEYPWDRLCDALHGEGVPSVDEALSKLRLRPLHDALRETLSTANVDAFEKILERTTAAAFKPSLPIATKAMAPKPSSLDSSPLIALEDSPIQTPDGAQPVATQPELQPFLDAAERFFDRAVELTPAGLHGAWEASLALPVPVAAESAEPQTGAVAVKSTTSLDPAKSYTQVCAAMLSAATSLGLLTHKFSADWQALSRSATQRYSTRGWAPLLAWIVVESLPWGGDKLALFDALQLREAVAESFQALGIEGEDAWRAAAEVRLLLQYASTSLNAALLSASFWHEPDVRWLASLNESDGTSYFNKESFESLVFLLQTPAMFRLAEQPEHSIKDVAAFEKSVTVLLAKAETSGYNLNTFLTPKFAVETAAAE